MDKIYIKRQQNLKFLTIVSFLSPSQRMSIIGCLPQLETIKSYWDIGDGFDGLLGVMKIKTNIKKIILFGMTVDEYYILGNITNSQWQFKGTLNRNDREVTFIREENHF